MHRNAPKISKIIWEFFKCTESCVIILQKTIDKKKVWNQKIKKGKEEKQVKTNYFLSRGQEISK